MPSASASAASAGRPGPARHPRRADARARVPRAFALLGQENPAIGAAGRQPLALQPRNRLDGGGMRNAKRRATSVGRASRLGQQVGDELDIVLEQGPDCAERVLPNRRACVSSAGSSTALEPSAWPRAWRLPQPLPYELSCTDCDNQYQIVARLHMCVDIRDRLPIVKCSNSYTFGPRLERPSA